MYNHAGFSPGSMISFGDFTFDPANAVLRKGDTPIRLRPQAFKILSLLVQNAGQLITRDRIRQEVWGDDTFVDFNQGLNVCVRQIRDALGDNPESPRFIETAPKLGYRFIAPVSAAPDRDEKAWDVAPEVAAASPQAGSVAAVPLVSPKTRALALASGLTIVIAVAGAVVWQERQSAASDPDPISSIAVLPLTNLSPEPDQDYFADGMTDALISDLAQIRALKVISRTSTMVYKQARKPLPEIGKELDVDAVVEGSVQRAGDRVRVDVRLVHAATDAHLWAQTYERSLGDVLTLQRDIARAVAVAVRASLTPEERSRLAEARPVNPAAYEAYMKGRHYRAMDDARLMPKAREYYEEAVRLDPDFALAHVALGELFIVFGVNGGLPADTAFPRARTAAERALRIDDRLGEPYVTLAAVRSAYDWDWPGTETYFIRSLERAPNYAQGRAWYAEYLSVMGRLDDAIRELRIAEQLDPLSPVIRRTTGYLLYMARQYDEMVAHSRATLELLPDAPDEFRLLSMAQFAQGHVQEAFAAVERSVAGGGGTRALIWLAYLNAAAGRRETAGQMLTQLSSANGGAAVPALSLAAIHAALGDRDRAMDLLEQARAARYTWTQRVQYDPMFDPLRGYPRFEAFRRRIAHEDGVILRD